MAQLKISVDLSGVPAAAQLIAGQVFPLLGQAVRAVAQQTQINWMESIQRARLWSGEKDAYSGSVQWQMTGPFSAVVWSDYKHAEEIETGRPARDLKKMLDTSAKVRRTKSGKRFLIIPFRHNTPGNEAHAPAMPQGVYDLASKMKSSRVIGKSERLSGERTSLHPQWGTQRLKKQTPFASSVATRKAWVVPKHHYQWGEKLETGNVAGLSAAEKKRYQNMYRFDSRTPGGKKYSSYLTFRVMMEGSSGWVVPPKPGLFLAKRVVDDMQPKAEAAFTEAIKRSL